MTLFRFLCRYSPKLVLWTTVAALLSGACNVALIKLINDTFGPMMKAEVASAAMPAVSAALLFAAFAIGRIVSNAAAQITLAHFSQETTARLRRDLVRRVLGVPLRKLEDIGAGRIMATLTGDVMEITQATLSVPIFAVNLAMLLWGAAYLGWLNFTVLIGMGLFALVGAATYRMFIRSGFGHLNAAREGQDQLFGHFRSLTEGIKELKLHRSRRATFMNQDIEAATNLCRRHNVLAEIRFIIAQNWNQLLFLGLIAGILFLLPKLQTDLRPQDINAFLITTLFLMGPLAGLLGTLAVFSRAAVSLRKVEELGLALDQDRGDEQPVSDAVLAPLNSIELVKVVHHYHREREDDTFMLGPIDLTLKPGELVFLVGGNGSGKSTLAKVIAGLYAPGGGEVKLNGRLVTDQNRDDYRQYFSAVFADFHLFDRITGIDTTKVDQQARAYLEKLHLNHKVTVTDGQFSTTSLSSGQRKRLALLCAYLEDRPFYLFDEWASDQDPLFKDVFYTQILPELRSRNKAVLVITHDDKYFPLADRLIKLDYGKLRTEFPTANGERPPRVVSAAPLAARAHVLEVPVRN